ncbi:MAG: nucleotidyltransferase family protein [Patescibacteria group bacterium]|jgi:hypothetical protein
MLQLNGSVLNILEHAPELNISEWYLGAGGITQTVWNILHGFAPDYGINDYDLVYWDSNTSAEAEIEVISRGKIIFRDITAPLDIVNEARVHIWYEKEFGRHIRQYSSLEDAISTWPTTATSIGVRKAGNSIKVFAPFGLDDLFNLVVRPNKALITEAIYNQKVDRWRTVWPKLKIINWDE